MLRHFRIDAVKNEFLLFLFLCQQYGMNGVIWLLIS